MRKFILVLINEISTTLQRRSFQFTAFGLPLIAFVIFIVSLAIRSGTNMLTKLSPDISGTVEEQQIPTDYLALLDESGFISTIPDSIPESSIHFFEDQKQANRAVETGQIDGYFKISEDYIQSGVITFVQAEFNPFPVQTQSHILEYLLQVNLVGGDVNLIDKYRKPLDLQQVVFLDDQAYRYRNEPLTFFLPFTITIFFFITILMAASLLLSNITKEKENRTLEILLVSTTPNRILSGKILGLGMAGLFQTIVWFGMAYLMLMISGRNIQLPFEVQLSPSFFIWVILFFILGYGVYASMMASIGALVSNLREASQLAFILLLPMMIPLFTVTITMRDPNGIWITLLSIFPFTAPVSMLTRLATVQVPAWQLILTVFFMLLTTYLVLRLVASLFTSQILFSGSPLSFKRLVSSFSTKP